MVTKKESIIHLLEDFNNDELISVYNAYAIHNDYEEIYPMDIFYPDLYSGEGRTPFEIKEDLEDVYEGDKYVSCDDVYGWKSFNDYWDSPNNAGETELANYIIEHDDNLGNIEIQEYLDVETLNDALGYFNNGDRILIREFGVKTFEEWFETLSVNELDYLVSLVDEEENYIELV